MRTEDFRTAILRNPINDALLDELIKLALRRVDRLGLSGPDRLECGDRPPGGLRHQ
jgi:hypothetical protein